MSQIKPSDTLKKPQRPLLVGAVIVSAVVALSGIGAGAYAIGQAVTAPDAIAPATEPTPTEEPNVAPSASFSILKADGRKISVDGSNSIDPDGAIVTYEWDFGDGNTATGPSAGHRYDDYDTTFTVTLTVTDAEGATGVFSADVKTDDAPPPPPPPPAASEGCPAGSFVAQGGSGVELLCMWNICTTLTLPDAAHPECDSAFRP
jgi:chitodextrinase